MHKIRITQNENKYGVEKKFLFWWREVGLPIYDTMEEVTEAIKRVFIKYRMYPPKDYTKMQEEE